MMKIDDNIFINSAKALSNKLRIDMVKYLLKKETSMLELSKIFDMDYYIIRNNMKVLKELNIVETCVRDGMEQNFKITDKYKDIISDLVDIYNKY